MKERDWVVKLLDDPKFKKHFLKERKRQKEETEKAMRQMSLERAVKTSYMLLQAKLYDVDQKIEANMDADPGAFNPEARDMVLRKERSDIVAEMRKHRR